MSVISDPFLSYLGVMPWRPEFLALERDPSRAFLTTELKCL